MARQDSTQRYRRDDDERDLVGRSEEPRRRGRYDEEGARYRQERGRGRGSSADRDDRQYRGYTSRERQSSDWPYEDELPEGRGYYGQGEAQEEEYYRSGGRRYRGGREGEREGRDSTGGRYYGGGGRYREQQGYGGRERQDYYGGGSNESRYGDDRPAGAEGPFSAQGSERDWEERYGPRSVGGRYAQSDRSEESDEYDDGGYYRGYYRASATPLYWRGGSGSLISESWTITGPHTGKGPRGYRRSNDHIVEEASQRLNRSGRIDASNIDVSCEDGVLKLTGTVEDRRTKREAEECVESIFGVEDVANELRVQRRQSQDETEREQPGKQSERTARQSKSA